MTKQAHPQTFCIDDLLNELHLYVKEKLQNAGNPDVDVDIYRYKKDHICRILADRESLRQALVHLLDNAVKFTDYGFIVFGYHVLKPDLVDFFVTDNGLGEYNDTPPDLSPVCELLQTMGSRLKKDVTGTGSSFSFSIKSERVEVTKLANACQP